MEPLYLKAGSERRILQGHRWIFSNEISSRLSDYEPGSWVEVFSSKGVLLGSGYINPKSLIAVRLVCRPGRKPSPDFFYDLIKRSSENRSSTYYPGSSCYRAAFGESDGLPGLIVDKYDKVIVYQITTLGMSAMEPLVQELLQDIFQPEALVFRHDIQVRALEGLPLCKGVAFGELPEEYQVDLDGVRYKVDVLHGQKTGLFLDQRDNRRSLRRWVEDKKVLDLFCYNGAWSLTAASAGARETTGVDQSPDAVAQAGANALLNGSDNRCRFIEEDALHFLKNTERGSFDIVILDPPAFAKAKNALPEAKKGYIDINRRAMLATKPGGMLVSCSCSYHVTDDLFRELLLQAAQAGGRQLKLLEARGQASDHPVLLAMPETRYLKCYFLEVL
ncbi:MAG: class I SAM-dependent rRNA methyltransferase [Syntrophobacteraceae bacterium]